MPFILVGAALFMIIGVVVSVAFSRGTTSGGAPPDVQLSIASRDTLLMSANELQHLGRRIDVSSWTYDTPACKVLSDYYAAYLTDPANTDVTVEQVERNVMSNGAVGSSLRNHTYHRGGSENVEEITEAALACSGYIATQH